MPSTTMKKPGADLALAGDGALGREVDLDRGRGDRRARPACVEPAEQRTAADQRRALVRGQRHGSSDGCRGGHACAAIRPGVNGEDATAPVQRHRAGGNHSGVGDGARRIARSRQEAAAWPRARRSRTSWRGSRCSATSRRRSCWGSPGIVRGGRVPEGERILRQGLTGSGFYVILDGTADVRIDGTQRGTLRRGDFFGEVSILLGEPPTADIVATHRRSTAS